MNEQRKKTDGQTERHHRRVKPERRLNSRLYHSFSQNTLVTLMCMSPDHCITCSYLAAVIASDLLFVVVCV